MVSGVSAEVSITMFRILLVLVFSLFQSLSSAGEQTPLRAGATYINYPNDTLRHFEHSLKLIERELGRPVVFSLYSIEKLEKAVREGSLDLVFTGAGFVKRLQSSGLRMLATSVSPEKSNPNRSTGTAIVTLKTRTDLNTLADLKGKRLAAVSKDSFQGYQIGMGEINRQYPPAKSFFSKTKFVGLGDGLQMDLVLKALENNEADVGFLSACYLENNLSKEEREKFKVVNKIRQKDIPCEVSTTLFPNWTISSLPSLEHESLRKITSVLFNMQADSNGRYWSVSADYRPVDELFKSLKIGPYEYLDRWTFQRAWAEYKVYVIALLLILLGIFGHSVRTEILIRKRTLELETAFKQQRKTEYEKQKAQSSLEKVMRLGIVGQMSTIFAHELKQPLNNIQCYITGTQRLLEEKNKNFLLIHHALDKIAQQSQQCAEVVDRVRSFAKKRQKSIVRVNVFDLLEKEIKEYEKLYPEDTDITLIKGSAIFVLLDRLDFKMVLFNLFRNAEQAERTTKHIKIEVLASVSKKNNHSFCSISVKDNGRRISDDAYEKISEPLFSTKEDGLGLGVQLIINTMEYYGGSLSFVRSENSGDGLTAIVELPLENKKNAS